MGGHLQKFYLYGYLKNHTSLSLHTTTLNNQQGLPQPHHQNANLHTSISPSGFQRIFLKPNDITQVQLPFGYHEKNECLIRSLPNHIMWCLLGCQTICTNGSQRSHNQAMSNMLVQVTIPQPIILLNNAQSLLQLGMLPLDMKKPNGYLSNISHYLRLHKHKMLLQHLFLY